MNESSDLKMQVVECNADIEIKGLRTFDCEDEVINKYVTQLKRQCARENVHALLLMDSKKKLAGFCTAMLYQLVRENIPADTFPHALPPTIAVMKIPMIAIDRQHKRQGWGQELLRAILDYCIEGADKVKGIKGVYLDAKIDSRSFYEQFDFKAISDTPSENDTIPMFISMDSLRESKRGIEVSAGNISV